MKDYFYTESLNVASFLKAHEQEVKQIVRLENRFVFYFERNEQVKMLINEYNNNSELKKFISAFKDIKKMMRNY